MKINEFTQKEQEILNKIKQTDLKNLFIPKDFDKSKHLRGFKPEEVEFLKKHVGKNIYLGGIDGGAVWNNWTKSGVEYYVEIKKATNEGKNPLSVKKAWHNKRYFNHVLKKIESYTLSQLEEMLPKVKDRATRKKAVYVKEKKVPEDRFIYKGFSLPKSLEGWSKERKEEYLFSTRMLNKRS